MVAALCPLFHPVSTSSSPFGPTLHQLYEGWLPLSSPGLFHLHLLPPASPKWVPLHPCLFHTIVPAPSKLSGWICWHQHWSFRINNLLCLCSSLFILELQYHLGDTKDICRALNRFSSLFTHLSAGRSGALCWTIIRAIKSSKSPIDVELCRLNPGELWTCVSREFY